MFNFQSKLSFLIDILYRYHNDEIKELIKDVYTDGYTDGVSNAKPSLIGFNTELIDTDGRGIHVGDIVRKHCVSGMGHDSEGEIIYNNGEFVIDTKQTYFRYVNLKLSEIYNDGQFSGEAKYELIKK